MMSVKEYAVDVNKSIDFILNLCKEMNINVNNEEDMLDDDAIIILDNEIVNRADEDYEEQIEDSYLEELEEIGKKEENIAKKKQKHKEKNKEENNDKADYLKQRKQMYKSKDKLQSNKEVNDDNTILYSEGMTISKLSGMLNVGVGEILKKVMLLGMMMNINSIIDFDTAEIIVSDYGKTLKKDNTRDEVNFEELEITENEDDLVPRAPVVTIMGHVDHGKTTLLDTIRKTNVASGEAGGITQAIGAYQIEYNGKKITFIDTPGHAAFTEMRARGASITDIVIIIIAADDGIMPQTEEVIDHAKAANVPIIVAINKIDKPEANVERVLTQLTEHGLTPESWGGDTIVNLISAKSGQGIDELLDSILLVAEMNEYKANPNRYAVGTVIESRLDKHLGPVVTVLVQNGTLRLGDPIVVGHAYGKIRTLKDDKGLNLTSTKLSQPVEITGINDVPKAGDKFMAFESEKEARNIGIKRQEMAKQKEMIPTKSLTLEDLFSKIQEGKKEINIIIKADVNGSAEAVKNSLEKIDVEGVTVNVIRSSVGAIKESDIVLAKASNAIIIGFNVRPDGKIKDYAKEQGVEIRLYDIIYKAVEEMEAAMKGMLEPVFEEKVIGTAEVRKIFKFSKVGTIAGSYVTEGIIKRDSKARLIRDGIVIYDGNINSIQREKDSVKEVKKGLECGITIENYNDIREKDVIEAYEMVEIKR